MWQSFSIHSTFVPILLKIKRGQDIFWLSWHGMTQDQLPLHVDLVIKLLSKLRTSLNMERTGKWTCKRTVNFVEKHHFITIVFSSTQIIAALATATFIVCRHAFEGYWLTTYFVVLCAFMLISTCIKGIYVTATNQAVSGLVIEWNTYVRKYTNQSTAAICFIRTI